MASTYLSFLVSDHAPNFNTELSQLYDPNAIKSDADVIPGSEVEFPLSGSQYGQITCDAIGLDAPVYWYDTEDILAYGVGQSLVSLLPGFGRVIILSGHNTTFFACLQDAAVGNVINFHTNYCDYQYTVTNVQVYNETELETLLLQKAKDQREELIMYTCYPFHAITGRKTDRLVVFANRTAGKDVDWVE
jgi:sortase A